MVEEGLGGVCRVCIRFLFSVTNLVAENDTTYELKVCRAESRQAQWVLPRGLPRPEPRAGLSCRQLVREESTWLTGSVGWIHLPVTGGLRSVSAGAPLCS